MLPCIGLSLSFRTRAKARGRTLNWFRPNAKGSNPFLDERLNDAYRLIRTFAMTGGLAMIAIAIVGGLALQSWELYWMALCVSFLLSSSRGLFVEGAIAFGAELTPVAPSRSSELDAARTA